jgi:hypothetical protein
LDHPRETVRAARGTRRRARAAGHAGRRTPAASPQGGRG